MVSNTECVYTKYSGTELAPLQNKTFSKNRLNFNTGEYRLDIVKAEIEAL